MRFALVDAVLERSADRIVTIKQVSLAEEYLQDHFPTFPVLPGVFMLEAMVQAARELTRTPEHPRPVLGQVRALKYGHFVKPGDVLRVEIELVARPGEGEADCKARALVLTPERLASGASGAGPASPPPVAASGRFLLRPPRPLHD
ncbi:MAG: hypothetical protein EA378_12310 [Phycisphaerales bacterium]|nr:MAG: hypothetical protein EA378_12310 [Phycisphaerales bacterium]